MQTSSTTLTPDTKRPATKKKKPVIPALFLPLGRESARRQSDGSMITFRVIELTKEYPGVYSKLHGEEGTWYTKEKMWVDVEILPTT